MTHTSGFVLLHLRKFARIQLVGTSHGEMENDGPPRTDQSLPG